MPSCAISLDLLLRTIISFLLRSWNLFSFLTCKNVHILLTRTMKNVVRCVMVLTHGVVIPFILSQNIHSNLSCLFHIRTYNSSISCVFMSLCQFSTEKKRANEVQRARARARKSSGCQCGGIWSFFTNFFSALLLPPLVLFFFRFFRSKFFLAAPFAAEEFVSNGILVAFALCFITHFHRHHHTTFARSISLLFRFV